MKGSLFFSIFILVFAGCSADESEMEAQDAGIKKNTPTYMTWRFTSACKHPGLAIELYDMDSDEKWGHYANLSYLEEITVQINCLAGHTVCHGAWYEKGPYTDCGNAEKTRECSPISSNPEYFWWGCGKDCKHPTTNLPGTCYDCWPFLTKNKYFNCQDS